MRQLIVTQWVSLDGTYDAISMNRWWNPFDSQSRQKYIQKTIDNCEIMLYGRRTYELLYPYWSIDNDNEPLVADKMNKCKKYVVSSMLKETRQKNTTILDRDFVEKVKEMKNQEGGSILVHGSGSLLKPLLEAGLVDELKLLINPAVVGRGDRPFLEGVDCNLMFLSFEQLDKNVVLLTYRAIGKDQEDLMAEATEAQPETL